MVSLWPWKADETASFEKQLSSLTGRISKATTQREALSINARRYKALWTLYTSFAYLLCILILLLVTGWQNWSVIEYAIAIGGPILIYVGRLALSTYYSYRLSSNKLQLDTLNKQKNEAIEKFKTATKYNSTQKLLEKYGVAPKEPSTPRASSSTGATPASGASRRVTPQQRTRIAPPPTANIRLPDESPLAPPQTSVWPESMRQIPGLDQTPRMSPSRVDIGAQFAPSAFPATAQYADQGVSGPPKWYDRLFDVLLGEDEARAMNRLALICSHCKLVNGLAPPGVKRMEEVGRWRCSSCKEWNGKEDEVQKIIEAVREGDGAQDEPTQSTAEPAKSEVKVTAPVDDEVEGLEAAEDLHQDAPMAEGEPPARSTRSQTKSTVDSE